MAKAPTPAKKTAPGKGKSSSPIHPATLAAVWPTDRLPLILWGINGKKTVLATALQQVKTADFFAKSWQDLADAEAGVPRWMGVLSYDEFCPASERKQPSLIYEIKEALVWDEEVTEPRVVSQGNPKTCALRLDESAVKTLMKDAEDKQLRAIAGNQLFPTMSDETYLGQVAHVQEEIRRGTFYQLNLLRWFRFAKPWSWEKVCSRVKEHGGPYSMMLRHGNTAVASFSPERFIHIEATPSGPQVHTWPIKGTIERHLADPVQDEAAKQRLLKSEKDLAELHMIVDLMRNDLTRICQPTSVEVVDSHQIKTFQHVHHLQAHVRGALRRDLTMGDIFAAIAPGGSITGAPKIEVMKHIHRLEARERGFMMGNAFIVFGDGSLDSNILIRTMTSSDGCRTWEYAAGSGLVIKSDPQQELQEVAMKCRPVTQP